MKKKIINILFNDFTNDNRVKKECISLIEGGFEVELVATRFEKKNLSEENIHGIKVRRVSVGQFSFLPMNLFFFWINIIRLYRKEKVFHCNDLYALPPAWFIKTFLNKKVQIVYDCHEYETEAGIYIGKPVLKWISKISERILIKSADKVICVSESIAEAYQEIYRIEKPTLVLNCPRYRKYEGLQIMRKELGIDKDKVIFLFQGEYQKGRGVDKLIEIFKKLETINERLVLVLLVYGDEIDILEEKIKDCKNILRHDQVSNDIYMNYVASCDWGIYLMENICKNNDYALPNKIFDYIMGGLPVVVSNLKEISKFVNENKVGYSIDPSDEKGIIRLLEGVTAESKKNFITNLDKTAKKYCWEEQEKALLKIYKNL